jgi:hypothetical protein
MALPATPTFFARYDYMGLDSLGVQVADTNGDGIPDLIADGDGIIVLLGNGDGTFHTGPVSYTTVFGGTFVAADMNGDGKVDVVLPGNEGGPYYPVGIAVCLGNGDGTFQSGTFYEVPDSGVDFVVVRDFNGDGIPDVAAAGASGVEPRART